MMSLAAIRQMSQEAAEEAAALDLTPYVPWDEAEVLSWPPFPFPNLGDFCPDGWEMVDDWLCDSSGMGADWEPALTVEQLQDKVIERLGTSSGYGIVEVGQFQVVVGVFEKID